MNEQQAPLVSVRDLRKHFPVGGGLLRQPEQVRAVLAYVELDTGVVREASEPQTWWYDEKAKRWYVAQGIPRVLCQAGGDTTRKPAAPRP